MPYTYLPLVRGDRTDHWTNALDGGTEKAMRISHVALTALVIGAALSFFQIPAADAG